MEHKEEQKGSSKMEELSDINKEVAEIVKNLKYRMNNLVEELKTMRTKEKGNILIKMNHPYNKSYLEGLMKENDESPDITETAEEGVLRCGNMKWLESNFDILVNTCSKIVLNDIKNLNIIKPLVIIHDLLIDSNSRTRLAFSNNCYINIRPNCKFEIRRFKLKYINYGDSNLIVVQESAVLNIRHANIRNNFGQNSLFTLNKNAYIELEDCVFKGNQSMIGPSCISAEDHKNISMIRCRFSYHTSSEYPESAFLIRAANGDVNITTCDFTNNYISDKKLAVIDISGVGVVNIRDSRFLKNCHLTLAHITKINIEDCEFVRNKEFGSCGGCLDIISCKDVNIERSRFNRNSCTNTGGAICFHSSSSVLIKRCTFSHNSTESHTGGAICFFIDSTGHLHDCIFTRNMSMDGGAMSVHNRSIVSCLNCSFDSNHAADAGGAVFNDDSTFNNHSSNVFRSNSAKFNSDVKE